MNFVNGLFCEGHLLSILIENWFNTSGFFLIGMVWSGTSAS